MISLPTLLKLLFSDSPYIDGKHKHDGASVPEYRKSLNAVGRFVPQEVQKSAAHPLCVTKSTFQYTAAVFSPQHGQHRLFTTHRADSSFQFSKVKLAAVCRAKLTKYICRAARMTCAITARCCSVSCAAAGFCGGKPVSLAVTNCRG